MNIFKLIFKRCKVWFSVTVSILVVLIAATIVLTSVLSAFMDDYFPASGTRGDKMYFTADEGITNKETALAAANAVNEEICEEGFVLLKNDGVLPVKTPSSNVGATAVKPKVSVFGKNSVSPAYGSSGSVGADSSTEKTSLYDSLESAGYEVNPTLKSFYENDSASGSGRPSSPSMTEGAIVSGFATGETPISSYTSAVKSSVEQYADLALVVITRVSGENYDLPMSMWDNPGKDAVSGAYAGTDHYLELDKNEQDMLQYACENCQNVVLIINASTSLELGFLDEIEDNDSTVNNYDFSNNVNAALWIGMPGGTGMNALGKILNGNVNPSGKTVDTYARDFTAIPAAQNFSCTGVAKVDSYYVGSSDVNQYFIDYEEGIYVGYRYFETRGAEDEEWYNNNVVYSFGYGLSYTTFSQKIKETNIEEDSTWSGNEELSVTVTVTNTGNVAGKDVVQIYAGAPYTSNEIEKSAKVLVGFAKTELIEPTKSQDITVKFTPYDFASYDYADKNGNGFKGYELDAGAYSFYVGQNAHDVYLVDGNNQIVTTTLSNGVTFAEDTTTGYNVTNLFDDADDQLGDVMSRATWNMPAMRSAEEKKVDSAFITSLNDKSTNNPITDAEVEAINAKRPFATKKSSEGIQLYDLIGKDYNDDAWDELLSRITYSSCWELVSTCVFKSVDLDYIQKPKTIDTDGPSGFVKFKGASDTVTKTCFYASEVTVASTWNTELAEKMGTAIGNEGIIGKESDGTPYSGWYAPGVNIHRTPFGGRNPEYYSEDGLFNGKMAASLIKGLNDKGVYAFVKHFAVNDQETHRGGVCTWLTEQSLREIYLKPFEIAVKEGQAKALMSSFNRIGTRWTGGDYRLMTEILRNEWGFKGCAISDYATAQSQMDIKQQLYAGADMWLDDIAPTNNLSKNSATDVYVLQESVKRILYTVANSNAMNGYGEGIVNSTGLAPWRIALIVCDVIIPVGLAAWGVFAILNARKKELQEP